MRICLLTPQLPAYSIDGGVGRYVATLAKEFASRGHAVTVCGVAIHSAGTNSHPWGRSVSLAVPRVIRRGLRPLAVAAAKSITPAACSRLNRRLDASTKKAYQACISSALQNWIEGQPEPFDIVESPNWLGYPSHFTKGRAFPLVVRLSSPASECGPGANQSLEFERASCQNADLVISNSQTNLENCRQAYRLPMEEAIVIHHGLEDSPIQGIERSREVLEFLCLARLEPRKGLDILIPAALRLVRSNLPCRFTFIGVTQQEAEAAFAASHPELTAACGEPNPRLRFIGKVPESSLNSHYEASHFVLIPSRYESFGLVAVESLRMGTPFVAAPSGGLVDVSEKSSTSRLVRENTPTDWENTLRELIDRGVVFAESLRHSSRENFLQCFSAQRMVEQSLSAYTELVCQES